MTRVRPWHLFCSRFNQVPLTVSSVYLPVHVSWLQQDHFTLCCCEANLKQEVLGICLGMQLLCNHTEEGDTKGLGVFDVDVKHFSKAVKVPHMGWNTIQNLQSDLLKSIPENSYMYSVHSYYADLGSQTIASSTYEHKFSAALQSDNFYGVQFHPEKSSKDGAQLLQNFLNL